MPPSKRLAAKPLPPVLAQAVIEADGVQFRRTCQLWEILPVGWNAASEQKRREWLEQWFRKELGLTPEQTIIRVEVNLWPAGHTGAAA